MPSAGESDPTSASLLERLQEGGDQDAWVRFDKLYRPLILYWCREGGVHAADHLDVCQDVFLKVQRAIGKFTADREQGSLRGWLSRITRNRIADYHRDRKNCPEVPLTADIADRLARLDVDEESPKPTSARLLLERALELVRGDFTANTWQAFLLHGRDGRPAPEVAGLLGITALAVRQARARVLRRLRAEFGNVL